MPAAFQPTAWNAKTRSHVFKPVVPRADHGMHVSLHRNLSTRYQRPDTIGNPLRYQETFKIIYSQRQPQRVFSSQAPVTSYPVEKTTRRLSCFDPIRGPPGSSINRDGAAPYFPYIICTKPMYSAEEVNRIVDRLYNRKKEEGRCPPKVIWNQRRKSYPAEMLEELLNMYCSTEKLCDTSPHRNVARHRSHVIDDITASGKKYTKGEVKSMIERLNEYNPNTWPPNSKGVIPPEASPRVKVKYPSMRAPSQDYVDDLVDRLYNGRINPDAYSQQQQKTRNEKKTVRAKTAPAAPVKNQNQETVNNSKQTEPQVNSANPDKAETANKRNEPQQIPTNPSKDESHMKEETSVEKNEVVKEQEEAEEMSDEEKEDEMDPVLAKLNKEQNDREKVEEIVEELN